jgi:argininosuccinate lyase
MTAKPKKTRMNKTWGGRFEGASDEQMEAFTESISIDQRLYRQDVLASQAHARMLGEVGLISAAEAEALVAALDAIASDLERGSVTFEPRLEDIHTYIEGILIERLGDLGRKLHTGRSRNDQVASDERLWVRDSLDEIDMRLAVLQASFLSRAEQEAELVLPGYTHLQRGQPVLAAHYLLAYVEKFDRDRQRLRDCRKRVNVLPLGAAALAGTSLPIDRDSVRRQLGFDSLTQNSLDAVSDRDFLVEFVFCMTMIGLHLSGWAEEWLIWSTSEFQFIQLPDALCTGSSIMPQKKNADALELIRGRSARVIGDLQLLLVLVKGLPLAYNRDLQEDKGALFDAYDTVSGCLEMAALIVQGARFQRDAITRRLDNGFLDATTLMERLVAEGVPIRRAHETVGKLVRMGEERGCRLADLPPEVFESVRPGLGSEVYKILGIANALAAFRGTGSTSPNEVRAQVTRWRQQLGTIPPPA